MKIIRILKSKRGDGAVWSVTILLVSMLILYGITEYARLRIISLGVRDAVESAVVSVANDNWDDAYAGLREGYSGAYATDGSSWQGMVDEGDVYERLDTLLGLTAAHEKRNSGSVEFRLSDLDITVVNTPFAPSGSHNALQADVEISLEVPMSFMGDSLPPMRIRMKLRAGYMQKF